MRHKDFPINVYKKDDGAFTFDTGLCKRPVILSGCRTNVRWWMYTLHCIVFETFSIWMNG